MVNRVFISYRRDDSRYPARRIYDAFVRVLPPDGVFMDVDSIAPGDDFVKILEGWVQQCDVLLALIGPGWINSADPKSGRRRLDNPDDFVRIEIRGALNREIQVVPVLLDDTPMPTADQLPDDIRALVRRQASFVEYRTFDADIDHLIRRLQSRRAEPPRSPAAATVPIPNTASAATGTAAGAGDPPPTPPASAPTTPTESAPTATPQPATIKLPRFAVLAAVLVVIAVGVGVLLSTLDLSAPTVPHSSLAKLSVETVQPVEPPQPLEVMPPSKVAPPIELPGPIQPALTTEGANSANNAAEPRPLPPKAYAPPNYAPPNAATSRTLLADIGSHSRWAVGTSKTNCSVPKNTYSLEVRPGSIIWRSGTGNVDVESISSSDEDEFRSTTQSSSHVEAKGENPGQSWTYSRDGDRVRVQPGGRSAFMLTRCS
jgi:hypothetical protein